MFGLGVFLIIFALFIFFAPNYLGHPDNYIPANSLSTPAHIVPEWYFLPFYAILRAVPDNFIGGWTTEWLGFIIFEAKLAGVLAMFGACQVGLGLTLFTVGSRLLPSGQASLIATLETPLMPFWVWLAFAEVPSLRALIGGALVMGAVVADIVVSQRTQPARQ